jgi:5-methylthioribose kinase
MSELLNENTVVPYLTARGVISGPAQVEILTGGVSNVVLAIKTESKDLVLKQALPQLKVKQEWLADQRRAIVEADAMRLFHSITPDAVPEILDNDPVEFTVTMQRLPRDCVNWKEEMLANRVNPIIGTRLGKILATWHNFGATDKSARNKFMEDTLFEQLRINPFYRAVAKLNPDLKKISQLINENETIKTTLVHGDFSPKNIMITKDFHPIVLDFEVEHTGNPVFDLAFVMAHLVCKYIKLGNPDIAQTAFNFMDAYQSESKLPIADSLAHHISLVALARVEGVSPSSYLDDKDKLNIVNLTKDLLRKDVASVAELFT